MKNVEVDGVTYNGVSSVSLRTTSGSYANFIDEDETTQTVVNSVSGKIIHVDDAVTNGVQDIELFDSGGTEITAATTVCIANKNLFRIDLLSASTVSKGITFTKNADGSITANGTSTGTYASASVTLDPAIFQAGQVFTISCGKSTGDLYVQLILNYTDGTTDYLVSRTGPTVFMVPKSVSTVTASVQITASGVTLTNQTIYPQIEFAGTPSAFVMNTYSQISYNGSTMPTLPASVANLWTSSSSVASMTMTYTVDVSANAAQLQSQNDTTTAVMLTKITRPEGGTIGQVLTKIGDDEETWDDVHGLPDGGTNGQVLTHTQDGAAWRTPTINEITDNSVLPVPSNVLYDAFHDIETDKISKPAGGTTGQVLKKTASGSEWGDAVDSTARNQISLLGSGAPIPVESLEDMVDTSKVYLYTSETQYNSSLYEKVTSLGGGDKGSSFVVTDNITDVQITNQATTGGWSTYLINSCALDINQHGNISVGYNNSYYLIMSRGSSSSVPRLMRFTKGGDGQAFSVVREFSNYSYPLWEYDENLRVTLINGILKITRLSNNTVLFEENILSEISSYTPCFGICYLPFNGMDTAYLKVLPTSQFLDSQGNAIYPPKTVIQNTWYYYDGTDWVAGGIYGDGAIDVALDGNSTHAIANRTVKAAIDTINETISDIEDVLDAIDTSDNHWSGKSWYAYGTSITNTSNEGKYATKLSAMSGLVLTNKGISGGGIGNLGGYSTGQVYNAICNTTDGKLNADLITLETGANDTGASVPLGTIYDTGTTTLAGCLNDCLRYLQTNTNAQIVVFNSPATTTEPTATNQYYEWAKMVKEICAINRVHFVDANCNLGYAKLASSNGSLYVVDNIHQTELGGYIYAQNIWNQLKNIPLFYTVIPS